MKKKKIIVSIAILILCLCYIVAAYKARKQNDNMYANAKELLDIENYEDAIPILEDLGEYKDAKEILEDTREKAEIEQTYNLGNEYIEGEQYLKAIEQFENVIDYKDSANKVKEASYYLALDYMNMGENDKAKEYFIKADGYEESEFCLSKLEILNAEKAKKNIYEQAVQKYNDGAYDDAIELFELIEDYKDSKEYIKECNLCLKRINKNNILSAGIRTSVAISNRNKVLVAGNNVAGQCNVAHFEDIVSVDTYGCYTIGLRKDKKVSIAGVYDGFDFHNTKEWENIIDIAAGEQFVLGLTKDGKVCEEVTNASRNIDTSNWDEVIAIDAGWNFAVGLTSNKELLFSGKYDEQLNEYKAEKDKWKNVVNISSGGGGNVSSCRSKGHTVGLCKDGTVVAIGDNNYGQCDVEEWTNMIKVVAGDWYTVGLQEGGKVFITGENRPGTKYIESDILDICTDIVDIAAGFGQTICLKEDGTILAFGFNDDGKCEQARNWKDILVP